jgi:hypothetical protein
MKEFFQLATFWLQTRQFILAPTELPFGYDLAGCLLGMNDCEK